MQASELSGHYTKEWTAYSKETANYTKRSSKLTTKYTKNTSEFSGELTKEWTAYSKETSDRSSKSSSNLGETTGNSSQYLDNSLEKTTKLSWDDFQAYKLDPDTADQLLKESYAYNGNTLKTFSKILNIPSEVLANALIESMPTNPSRYELENIMKYLIPELKIIYKNI